MAGMRYDLINLKDRTNTLACHWLSRRNATLPRGRYVSLAFDDFPRSAYTEARPLIESRGWRATWYVCGGLEGRQDPMYGAMFKRSDLLDLHARGHDIGCHTYDHVDCAAAPAREVEHELARNDAYLSSLGLPQCSSFAFPFGAANLAAKRNILRTGLALRGVKPGLHTGTADLGMLKAVALQANMGGTDAAHDALDILSGSEGWLILFTHDVRAGHSPYGTTPEAYAELLAHVERTGAEVLSVDAMLSRLASSGTQENFKIAA